MHVKVFEATDMASGLSKVRKELGPDALIISTRTVKNGKLGVLGKSTFEITAAADSEPLKKKKDRHIISKKSVPTSYSLYTEHGRPQPPSPPPEDKHSMSISSSAGKDEIFPANSLPASKPESQKQYHIPEEFQKELQDVKNLLHNLTGEMNKYGQHMEEYRNTSSVSTLKTNMALESLFENEKNTRDPLTKGLLEHGINLDSALFLAAKIQEYSEDLLLSDNSFPENLARKALAEHMAAPSSSFFRSDKQRKIAFVGPTGVGKTTTLAKIAAQYLASVSDSIALVTIDTYRIAAVEQLKVYGELMNLPVDVVITPRELDQTLFRHRDKDLILIDTAGRSPYDSMSFEELSTFFLPDFGIENHLVLSATTRENELSEICSQFNKLNISNLIVTKTDECSQLGIIFNLLQESGYPLAFITNGQRVPEDLLEAASQKIAQLIIPVSEGILHD